MARKKKPNIPKHKQVRFHLSETRYEDLHPDAAFYLGQALEYANRFRKIMNERLSLWPDAPRSLVRMATMSTTSSMLTLANMIDNGSRMIMQVRRSEWMEMMANTQKAYFSWLHSATELGLMRICELNGLKVVNSQKKGLEDDLTKLEGELTALHGAELAPFTKYKTKTLRWNPHPFFGSNCSFGLCNWLITNVPEKQILVNVITNCTSGHYG